MAVLAVHDALSTRPDEVDLTAYYPLAHRSILRRSWIWLGVYWEAATLVITRHLWATGNGYYGGIFSELLEAISFYVLFGGLAACALKLIYEELYYASWHYGIEAGNFVVAKGVVIKSRSSYPLTRVNDVYLERNFVDFLFGLYNLNVATPNPASYTFGKVEGLSRDVAVAMQDYITQLLDELHPRTEAALQHASLVTPTPLE
ncbi:MAG: PH domain-containing protein [Bdellovibrionales bacterium]|nr:PH domain-containing protein [Bdellovibrionales bacterium]